MISKAMILTDFNEPLTAKEIEIPELQQEGQVLVRLTASGVCGSDAYMWHGHDPRTPLPIILGHEGVGEIVEIRGSKKSVGGEELKAGQPVLWHRGVSCGKCFYCKVEKEPSFCEDRWVYGINRSFKEYPHLLGGYASHVILNPETDIFTLPEGASPEALVSVSCSGSTTAHAFELAPVNFGDNVVIQGPGPLGIYAVVFAVYSGAREIIVIGGTEKRLEICKEAGATRIINRHQLTREERKDLVLQYTEGRGADVVFEMAGSPTAVDEGIKLVKKGGTYASAGFGEPRGTVELECFLDIGNRNVNYQGVWVSDARHTYQALKIALKYQDIFSRMVTHTFPLSQATEALKKMDNKEAVKAVIIPE